MIHRQSSARIYYRLTIFEHQLKLLTLFGRADGSMGWRVNRYSDGSGGDKDIYPCISYEDAKGFLETKIKEEIETNEANKRPDHVTRYMIEAKKKYGLCMPSEGKIKEYYKKAANDLSEVIEKDKEKINKKCKELEDLRIQEYTK